MGLNGYFLIFIMVKINKKMKITEKNKGKSTAIEGFRVDNNTYTWHKIYGCQIGQRDRPNANKYCPQQLKHLHDAKLNTFHSHPQCDSKEWNIPTNYSYPSNNMLQNTIIGIIVIQHSNFTFMPNI